MRTYWITNLQNGRPTLSRSFQILIGKRLRSVSKRMSRLMPGVSLALQYGAPLEKVGDLLAGAKFAPCGPVVGHDHIKCCTSLPDLIGRHVLVEYCGREDLAHVSASVKDSEHPRTTLSNA
jgi:hypothetical protein